MLILALDSAVARCSATIVAAGTVVVEFRQDLERGHASVLPVMARDCLHDAGLQAVELDIIAVTVGPGSFTGIRAGVALAQGISFAAGCPAIAVTVGEALAKFDRSRSPICRIRAVLSPLPVRPLWMSPAGSPLEG
jgi:tRNA threonylcarbamoyladenosine biosynthesis protein TsaB